MLKKKVLCLLAILFCSLFSISVMSADTYAYCDGKVLGLPRWCSGLSESPKFDTEEALESYIWTIVINIAGIILGVVGYIAVVFVMWGGFQYLFSSGDPGKAAKGKKTITNALIGSVLCLVASTLVGALNGIFGAMGKAGSTSDFFAEIFNRAFIWGGILCVLMMVIGGISYAMSAGNPGKITKAKNTIMYSAIGLIIIILAAAIVNFVLKAVSNGQVA